MLNYELLYKVKFLFSENKNLTTEFKIFKLYNPTIVRIIKYKLRIKIKLDKITNQRNFGVLNKFLKGVNIININPIILLIKNRGYLTILVQKLFIIIVKYFNYYYIELLT